MKLIKKVFAFMGFLSVGLFLTACDSNSKTKPTDTKPTETRDTEDTDVTPSFDPELAMTKFIDNILLSDYVMETDSLITTVSTENYIYFDYVGEGLRDRADVSVNGEVFELYIEDGQITKDNTYFYCYGSALFEVSKKYNVLASIIDVLNENYNGNPWDMFTNIPDKPGEFTSNDYTLKAIMLLASNKMAEYAELMGPVTLTIDDNDVSKAKLTGKVETTQSINFDVEIDITFGEAEKETIITNWMEEPVLPDARTEWNSEDIGALTAIFYAPYVKYIPFIDGASYALYVDYEGIMKNDVFLVCDKHVDEGVWLNYVCALASEEWGYEEYNTDIELDHAEYYRKLIMPDEHCYISIYVEYSEEEGLVVLMKQDFDYTTYSDIQDINYMLDEHDLVILPEDDSIVSINAEDITYEYSDSILYIFEYDLVSFVYIDFASKEDAEAYFDKYKDELLSSGYYLCTGEFGIDSEYYVTLGEEKSVRYLFDDNTLCLKFKANKKYSESDINESLTENGFATFDFTKTHFYTLAKSSLKNQKYQKGHIYDYYFDVRITFKENSQIDDLLNDLALKLDDLGFGRDNVEDNAELTYYYDSEDGIKEAKLEGTKVIFTKGNQRVTIEVLDIPEVKTDDPTAYQTMVIVDFITEEE